MEELHAAIADYLRDQRPITETEREATILGLWRDRCNVPCCRFCGRAIVAGDEMIPVTQLRAARACTEHSVAF